MPSARTASKTAKVPITLTLAPRMGSARQSGNLEPGQMNHMADTLFLQNLAQPGHIGHVPLQELNLFNFFLGQDQAEAFGIFFQIVDPHLVAALSSRLRAIQEPMQP